MDHFNPSKSDQHFFASTVLGWGVGQSPMEAMAIALKNNSKTLKATYGGVWHVPVPLKEPYEIRYYAPQVEGATKIFEGEFNHVKKTK